EERNGGDTRQFFSLFPRKNSMNKLSKMHKRVTAAHGAMLVLSTLPAAMAMAQTAAPATELQTVTVTAQRRTENIKEVPVSVTAIKGEKLDVLVSGGEDIRLLAGKTPSLNVESSNGRTFPRFYIRGYGNTGCDAKVEKSVLP